MIGGWALAKAAVVGPAHVAGGLPCQDAVACREFPWGAVLALADGAGSAPASDAGAQAAVEGVIAWAAGLAEREIRDVGLAAEALDAARDAVYAKAASLGRPPAELASTLLVAVLRNDGEALLVQLGDGALVIRKAGVWTLALLPSRGEYANETFFVTSADAHDRLTSRLAGDVDAAALCSDGLERLVIDSTTASPHSPFFDRAVGPLGRADAPNDRGQIFEELMSSGVAARLSDDDKSIAAAVRRASSPVMA